VVTIAVSSSNEGSSDNGNDRAGAWCIVVVGVVGCGRGVVAVRRRGCGRCAVVRASVTITDGGRPTRA